MADEDFKIQLEQEALEKQKQQQQGTSQGSDPYTYTDPNDGTVYEWDHSKQAWFPKIDDDFIANYQANYQYQDQSETSADKDETAATKAAEEQEQKGVKRKANDPTWFEVDDAHNTNVYVSGLPLDTTEVEFIELMSKCGLVMKDPDSMKYKVKLYRNEDGSLKGDALCCYIKIESVGLALNILDGYMFKSKTISVQRAQFQLKGAYDPSKKPKKKKSKDKEKLKKKLDKLFDWRPDKLRGMRSRNEKTVIIKNMFDPKEFENEATLILEYQKDVREECSKCGEVKKVVVYDRNPEGVISVTFAEPEMADECISLMNGRWFAGRRLTAETWDGKTKYKIVETEEERQKRLKGWETFLAGENQTGENQDTKVTDAVTSKESNVETTNNKVVVAESYDTAAATDSSGDSEEESDAIKNPMGPVMGSGGSFTYNSSSETQK